MKQYKKNAGLADWVFILCTLGAVIIGNLAVKTTKVPDSPVEQAMEGLIRDTTGQQVDFSADLKKDKYGNIVEEHVVMHKPGSRIVTDGKTGVPVDYRK